MRKKINHITFVFPTSAPVSCPSWWLSNILSVCSFSFHCCCYLTWFFFSVLVYSAGCIFSLHFYVTNSLSVCLSVSLSVSVSLRTWRWPWLHLQVPHFHWIKENTANTASIIIIIIIFIIINILLIIATSSSRPLWC